MTQKPESPNDTPSMRPGGQPSVDETREQIARQREAELAKRHTQVSDNVIPKGGK